MAGRSFRFGEIIMYKKILHKKYPRSFGDQVFVFEGENDYFLIVADRDGVSYYFVDKALKNMYPASSYLTKMGADSIDAFCDVLEFPFKIVLDTLGHGDCPQWVIDLVKQIS